MSKVSLLFKLCSVYSGKWANYKLNVNFRKSYSHQCTLNVSGLTSNAKTTAYYCDVIIQS